jgi:hypothetical protein
MISVQAEGYAEELFKLAALQYRKAQGVDIAKGIPIVSRMPKTTKAIQKRLEALTSDNEKAKKVLGYTNVAVPKKALPPLEELGFKPTRIATPLPGEKPLTISWRKGKLHAHQLGPIYLMHQDKHDPKGKLGYLSLAGLKHGITEGLPSMMKRMKQKQALVKGRAAEGLRQVAEGIENA